MIALEESPPPRQLDPDNPWPALDAFEESSRDYFHGREVESQQLILRIEEAALTVLFGKSGLGKTSLLKAGLFPRLRNRGFLPIYVRLDIRGDAPPLVEQVRDAIAAAFVAERVEAPRLRPDDSLWEYLHRGDFEVWSNRNALLTPLIVLDQFEEVFTLGERARDQIEHFRVDLADLAENRIPATLAEGAGSEGLDVRRMRYKMVVSLREDFLPDLEGWRRATPSLGRSRFRILAMNPQQAFDAVYRSAEHLMDEATARAIVGFVAQEGNARAAREHDPEGGGAGIEPALLSLFCAGLNERRKRAGLPRIDTDLLHRSQQGVISDYYRGCVEGLPERVGRFIEAELITEKGWRNSFAREDAVPEHLKPEELEHLIHRRLLRVEERYGTQRIELSHDLLTRAVREHRDVARAAEERAALQQETERAKEAAQVERLRYEAAQAQRFKRVSILLGVFVLVAIGMAIFAGIGLRRAQAASAEARRATKQAEAQKESARKHGALAQQRLRNIIDGINMKQAVLAGDLPKIRYYLDSATLRNTSIRFAATAKSRGYKDSSGREVYRFSIFPARDASPAGDGGIGLVTYRMDHPTFQNSLLVTGPERSFVSTYDGWGCLCDVVALIEYRDADHAPQITEFDMCAALGGKWNDCRD